MDNSQGKQSLTVSRYCFGTGPATFSTSKQPMQKGVVSQLTNPKSHRTLKVAGGSAMKGIRYILAILAIGILGLGGCEYTYPFEEEPNNSPTDATFVRNQIVKGQIHISTDMDYWKINLGTVTRSSEVKLTHLSEDLKIMAFGYDINDNQITLDGSNNYLNSDNDGTENESIRISNDDVVILFVCVEASEHRGLPGSYWLEHYNY